MKDDVRVIFAGGGTGGHIFPAIYMARYLKEIWGANCLFVGTKKGLENLKVSQAGFVVKHIWISGIKRGLHLGNLLIPLKLIISMIQSRRELKEFKPDLVIGTGGYVAGPVLYQATKMKIPTAIQEQNSYPGITTRLLASKVDIVFLAYEEALKYLRKVKKHKIVGNPNQQPNKKLKPDEARNYFVIKRHIPTVLIFGGSQGAESINKAVSILIQENAFAKAQVIWQTGPAHFKIYGHNFKDRKNIRVFPFIDRMDYAYLVSDFAICRAGAMTISELASAALPAILIPYPHAAADHQFKNARVVANNGGAILIKEKSGMNDLLRTAIANLLGSTNQLKSMSEKISAFHHPDTNSQIGYALGTLIRKNKGVFPSSLFSEDRN